jgi:hypothetical protein
MLVQHPYLCNRKKFRNISAILCQLGHNRDIGQNRDCPGQIGTLGNYGSGNPSLATELRKILLWLALACLEEICSKTDRLDW